MSVGRGHPEVFAGAAAESAKDTRAVRDVEIAASFSADEIRHLQRPRVRSRIEVDGKVERLDETARENLPEKVEPGRVYKDVRLRRNFGARLMEEPGDGA
jgi:hypothetical protein